MNIHIINQPPVEVTSEQAKTIMQQVANGAEIVIVGSEMIRVTSITGIRNDVSGEKIPVNLWGTLPEGRMAKFYDDRRENLGPGYEKYQAMKAKLFGGA